MGIVGRKNQPREQDSDSSNGAAQNVRGAWYADPFGERRLRWWDGSRWTDEVRDNASVPDAQAQSEHRTAATDPLGRQAHEAPPLVAMAAEPESWTPAPAQRPGQPSSDGHSDADRSSAPSEATAGASEPLPTADPESPEPSGDGYVFSISAAPPSTEKQNAASTSGVVHTDTDGLVSVCPRCGTEAQQHEYCATCGLRLVADKPEAPSPSPVSDAPAIGWYRSGPAEERYWDGRAWTEHVRAPQGATDEIYPQPALAQGPGKKSDPMVVWGFVTAVLLAPVGIFFGIRLLVREKVGPGIAVILVALLAWGGGIAYYVSQQSGSGSGQVTQTGFLNPVTLANDLQNGLTAALNDPTSNDYNDPNSATYVPRESMGPISCVRVMPASNDQFTCLGNYSDGTQWSKTVQVTPDGTSYQTIN